MIWLGLTCFFGLVIAGAFLYVLDQTIKKLNDENDFDLWK